MQKRLGMELTLYQVLQILSLTLFEKAPILQVLQPVCFQDELSAHQLNLFDCADVHSAETIVSVCRVGLKVMDGGGFAASLNEFSKAWAIYFPDVVSSKSKKALTKM
jgi:hypothetical protein